MAAGRWIHPAPTASTRREANRDRPCHHYHLCNDFYRCYSIKRPYPDPGLDGSTRRNARLRIPFREETQSGFKGASIARGRGKIWFFSRVAQRPVSRRGVNHPRGSRATPWNPLHRPVYVHIAFIIYATSINFAYNSRRLWFFAKIHRFRVTTNGRHFAGIFTR